MATQTEIDELFRQTLEGDYDDEDEEGGPWEAVSKLQAIASNEADGQPVFDKAVQWCRNKQPAKRRRGVDILAQLGKTDDHPYVTRFARESYAVITSVLEDELDLQVIDSCLVALGRPSRQSGRQCRSSSSIAATPTPTSASPWPSR